jgi:predicted ATPase
LPGLSSLSAKISLLLGTYVSNAKAYWLELQPEDKLVKIVCESLFSAMYISKFAIANYKSYGQSEEIDLKPGFNVVVGQNSAGKTALLEGMHLQFAWNPHRSLKTVLFPGAAISGSSSATITFALTRDELLAFLGGTRWYFTTPDEHLTIPGFGKFTRSNESAQAFLTWLFGQTTFHPTVAFNKVNGGESLAPTSDRFRLYTASAADVNNEVMFMLAQIDRDGTARFVNFAQANLANDVVVHLASRLRSRIYRFWAERFNFGESPVGTNRVLKPNAENLPEVLDLLAANTKRLEHFNRWVHEILPQVQHVSVSKIMLGPPSNAMGARILVWAHDPATEREDLANSLNQCGSGVGQVLAMLYVVMNSNEPQVILVDEPQSFLHPGALRKLIEVFREFSQHQYIFATHSPAVITATDPMSLSIVRATAGESKLEKIDPSSAKHAQAYLVEVGARLSDVFGADNILWAEGQTEEDCFPQILRRVAKMSLMGTAILGIRQVGDLQGRDKEKVLEIYHRLSEANALLPPAIGFVFDEECLSDDTKKNLLKMGHGLVHFLPRRMYENYLLDPEGIAAVVNEIPGFRMQPVLPEELRQWLDQKRNEREKLNGTKGEMSKQLRYFCKGTTQVPADWERQIDAAGILKDLFNEFSETRVPFEKTTHSVVLTEWLAEHKPAVLKEVADLLVSVIKGKA